MNGTTPMDSDDTSSPPPTTNGDAQQNQPQEDIPMESPAPEPIDPEACKALGNKYFIQKDYSKAIDEYSKAISADPRNATYLSNRAAAYMSAGKYAQALEDCLLSDRFQPNVNKTLLRLSRVYVALGRPEEALDIMEREKLGGSDLVAAQQMAQHVRSATSSLEDGNGSMTLFALDKAESGLGNKCEIPRKWRLMRGEANLRLGNANSLGEAQNVVMSLLRQNSNDPDALVLRGKIFYAEGDNAKAAQHFQVALRFDPDLKTARTHLKMARELDKKKEAGNEAFKKGDLAAARQLYTEALAVDENNKGTNAKIYQNRAMTLMKVCVISMASIHNKIPLLFGTI